MVAGDCLSSVCTGNLCQAESCVDGVLNGAESDVKLLGDAAEVGEDGTKIETGFLLASGRRLDEKIVHPRLFRGRPRE